MRAADLSERLDRAAGMALERDKKELASCCARLEALNPLGVLRRGYAAVSRDGKTVTRAADIHTDDWLAVRFADGSVDAIVKKRGET